MPEGAYIPDEFIPNKNRVGAWGLNNEKGDYEKDFIRIASCIMYAKENILSYKGDIHE